MAGPITALVVARLRHRGRSAGLSIAAIATAMALVVAVSGIALIASDALLARALASDGPERTVVSATNYLNSDREVAATRDAATMGFAELGTYADSTVSGVLFHELRDLEAPAFELLAATDGPAPWVTLSEGRLPAPCIDGRRCEAILLAEERSSFEFSVAHPASDLELTIVGRGQIDPAVPFGDLDQRGPLGTEPGGGQYQTDDARPAVLLVDGIDAMSHAPALRTTGRTYVWTAPIRVDRVHPWTIGPLREAVAATTRQLAASDTGFSIASPIPTLDVELQRADAGGGRLLLIGSLGVAILLAFAVFLALVARDDVRAEVARLTNIGARHRDRGTFLLLEAAVPAVIGGLIGWVAGALVVAGLAAWNGQEAAAIVADTVASPATAVAMLAVLLVAVAAIVAVSAPRGPSAGVVLVAAVIGLTVVVMLGWQLVAGGALGSAALARSLASPIVVVLPPALAFLLAIGFVAVLPPSIRWLARRSRAAPLSVRLSLLSISRDATRPAATLTLLAFSLGAIVFATGWSATLHQGIVDGAAYRAGLDLRVRELGTGLSIGGSVVPVDRYQALGPDVAAVPVYRDGAPGQPGGRVDIVGLPPATLPGLPGWRSEFSATPIDDLAAALELPTPAGGWARAGYRLPADAADLAFRLDYTGRPLRLDAVVETASGDTATVALGDVDDATTEVRAVLPEGARGGLLTALILRNPGLVAGSGHQDELRRATITLHGLDGLIDDTPREVEVFTTSSTIIRAPQATDGLHIPAVVSPDLAATATADGSIDLAVGNDATIPLRVVGISTHIPSVEAPSPRFIVVPIEPFLLALGAELPAGSRPTEMWLSVPGAERLPEVRAALADAPFRFAQITSRADLETARAADPLSQAVVWTLVLAAVAGLVLSVGGLLLGASTDLRDELGELADLEAQGVAPSTLRWRAVARSGWLLVGGSLAGLAVGLVLTIVVTEALALTADGTLPIPPLRVVVPVWQITAIIGSVTAVVIGLTAWMARRTYGRATLGERRGRRASDRSSTTLQPESSGSADG
jgi:hypothetical protein